MLTLAQTLPFYKRKDIQKLIVEHSQDKEIGVRFNESFGKRPDIIKYENDVFELAKQGATSFHCSEELWENPLGLNANLRRNELDNLRKGWDLILDIDCPYWDFSKLTAYVFIKALKDHKIESVTVKFSGGKGFHIAVPFEAFPLKIAGKNVKDLFPEGPRIIAEYLLYYINESLVHVDRSGGKIQFGKVNVKLEKLFKDTGKSESELIKTVCSSCKKDIKTQDGPEKEEFICPYCETVVKENKQYMKCPKCSRLMEKQASKKTLCSCGSNKSESKFDMSSIVNVDTVLISSRHLYRMPYSMHEKTGLVSVPFDIRHILAFDKEEALPSRMKPFKFLDRKNAKPSEATELFQKAFDHKPESAKKDRQDVKARFEVWKRESDSSQRFEDTAAIPEEFFPPCIKKISAGLEDGKKRALFILINFLGSCNWEHDKIEEYVMKWNERNKPDKLKETYVKGQLRYYKQQAVLNNKMPAPNCDNRGYMIDTQFCNPDGLCRNIKNPVQYSKKKVWLNQNGTKRPKKKPLKEKQSTE